MHRQYVTGFSVSPYDPFDHPRSPRVLHEESMDSPCGKVDFLLLAFVGLEVRRKHELEARRSRSQRHITKIDPHFAGIRVLALNNVKQARCKVRRLVRSELNVIDEELGWRGIADFKAHHVDSDECRRDARITTYVVSHFDVVPFFVVGERNGYVEAPWIISL